MCSMRIRSGIWPTMITPFTPDNRIDYSACEQLIEMYAGQGAAGIFACCQSSEMAFLTRDEKVALTDFVVKHTPSNVDVVASGHTEDDLRDQIDCLKRIADTGVKAVVLVTNRLAQRDENDDHMKQRIDAIINAMPDTVFGLYECPYPYKRLLTPEMLTWCAQTKHFAFMKDTCCNVAQFKPKIEVLKSSGLSWFNANAETLLESLQLGGDGFCGIMANFHLDLYVWLWDLFLAGEYKQAEGLQSMLSLMSLAGSRAYPVSAKYYLSKFAFPVNLNTRSKPKEELTENVKLYIDSINPATEWLRSQRGGHHEK